MQYSHRDPSTTDPFLSFGPSPLARNRRPPDPVFVHRLASLLHASFRPHLSVTPLRFATLHLHQVWQRTFNSKLSNMHGLQVKKAGRCQA